MFCIFVYSAPSSWPPTSSLFNMAIMIYPLWVIANSTIYNTTIYETDLNGDCLADLVVTSVSRVDNVTNQLEIWINGKTAGYSLYSVQVLPKGSGQLSFGDFGT